MGTLLRVLVWRIVQREMGPVALLLRLFTVLQRWWDGVLLYHGWIVVLAYAVGAFLFGWRGLTGPLAVLTLGEVLLVTVAPVLCLVAVAWRAATREPRYPLWATASQLLIVASVNVVFEATIYVRGALDLCTIDGAAVPISAARCSMPYGSYWDSLYFSVVTWTTLGYGDYAPEGLVRIVAAGQALLGYITMGIMISLISAMCSNRGSD